MNVSEWRLRENVLKRFTFVFKQRPHAENIHLLVSALPHLFTLFSHLGVHWWSFLPSPWLVSCGSVEAFPRRVSSPGSSPARTSLSSLSLSQASLLCQLSLQLALYFKCFSSDRPNSGVHASTRDFSETQRRVRIFRGLGHARRCRQGLSCALCPPRERDESHGADRWPEKQGRECRVTQGPGSAYLPGRCERRMECSLHRVRLPIEIRAKYHTRVVKQYCYNTRDR